MALWEKTQTRKQLDETSFQWTGAKAVFKKKFQKVVIAATDRWDKAGKRVCARPADLAQPIGA